MRATLRNHERRVETPSALARSAFRERMVQVRQRTAAARRTTPLPSDPDLTTPRAYSPRDERAADALPIPCDARHEFLDGPLLPDDPSLLRWIEHFDRLGSRYERVVVKHGRIMLYTHRATGSGGRKWCCRYRKVKAGKKNTSLVPKHRAPAKTPGWPKTLPCLGCGTMRTATKPSDRLHDGCRAAA